MCFKGCKSRIAQEIVKGCEVSTTMGKWHFYPSGFFARWRIEPLLSLSWNTSSSFFLNLLSALNRGFPIATGYAYVPSCVTIVDC